VVALEFLFLGLLELKVPILVLTLLDVALGLERQLLFELGVFLLLHLVLFPRIPLVKHEVYAFDLVHRFTFAFFGLSFDFAQGLGVIFLVCLVFVSFIRFLVCLFFRCRVLRPLTTKVLRLLLHQ
jgi:hypothetical protein